MLHFRDVTQDTKFSAFLGEDLDNFLEQTPAAVSFKHKQPLLQLLSSLGNALDLRWSSRVSGEERPAVKGLEVKALRSLLLGARRAGQFQVIDLIVNSKYINTRPWLILSQIRSINRLIHFLKYALVYFFHVYFK